MRYLTALTLVFILLQPNVSRADSDYFHWTTNSPDFALHLSGSETDVRYDDTQTPDSLEWAQVKVSVAERILPGVKLRLHGSLLGADQDDRVASRGLDLTGYGYGIHMEFNLTFATFLALEAQSGVTYFSTEDNVEEQQAELDWLHWESTLGIRLNYSLLAVRAGFHYQEIDGEEEAFGTTLTDVEFEEADTQSAYFGLEFQTDKTGYVGLTAYTDPFRKIEITLQRRF
ncbi:MAG TPA: hypothetical protein DCZ12_14080 [Gammaproteobacteria bacterium]|nr:hypothetical protein [Gammaproteobacteria bacterium]